MGTILIGLLVLTLVLTLVPLAVLLGVALQALWACRAPRRPRRSA